MKQSLIFSPVAVHRRIPRTAWRVVLMLALAAAAANLLDLGNGQPQTEGDGDSALVAAQALAGEFFVLGATPP